jgi:aminoglycoside phosphotransferase (APT) family kinase protein
MSASSIDIIPAERRDSAAEAIRSAFGSPDISTIQPVTGGASGALIYRIEIAGTSYVLRLEVLSGGGGFRDPRRGYACMAAAAAAGVAPTLHHLDADAGVAIMDFVSGRPLASHPRGQFGVVEDLGALTARVHAIEPVFPEPRADYGALVDFMLAGLRRSGLFAPGALDPHMEGLTRLRAALGRGAPGVSSHNDPNPRNILFDGERLWLVDWELAFRNDPLVDVAILANEFAPDPSLADALLRAALGCEPDDTVRARFTLNRQLVRAFYACILLGPFALRPRETPDDLLAPTPDEFRAAVARGRLKIGSPELIYTYGKMHLAGFLAHLSAPAFQQALAEAP